MIPFIFLLNFQPYVSNNTKAENFSFYRLYGILIIFMQKVKQKLHFYSLYTHFL